MSEDTNKYSIMVKADGKLHEFHDISPKELLSKVFKCITTSNDCLFEGFSNPKVEIIWPERFILNKKAEEIV